MSLGVSLEHEPRPPVVAHAVAHPSVLGDERNGALLAAPFGPLARQRADGGIGLDGGEGIVLLVAGTADRHL